MTYWDRLIEWLTLLPYWAKQLGPQYWSHTYAWPEDAVKRAFEATKLAGEVELMVCPITRWIDAMKTTLFVEAKDRRQAQIIFRSIAQKLRTHNQL